MAVDQTVLPSWMLAFHPLEYVRDTGETEAIRERLDRIRVEHARLFKNPVKSRAQLLPVLKTMYETGRDMLKTAFMANNDGAAYLGGHTMLVDTLIRLIHDSMMATYPAAKAPKLALLATGGYGRSELCPHSDIDLLFLTEVKPEAEDIQAIEFILYLLWDLGMDVGHASRSLRQAIRSAKDDLTIRTALLEGRHLAGDSTLTDRLMEQFRTDVMANTARSFISAKLDERDARHKRSDARRYMLEPNIKDGKGGLRDLHTLFWITRYGFNANSVLDLVNSKILTHTEARAFSTAQRFLWTLRCHMHLRSGREDDRLSFDAQMDIASLLDYSDRSDSKGVERFMRHYFLTATTVGSLTRIFCAAIADDFNNSARSYRDRMRWSKPPHPFIIQGNRIALKPGLRFSDHQRAMMDVFLLALESDQDIHPQTLRQMARKLSLLDQEFRADPEHNAVFLSILSHKKNPERILRLMNEVGVLGKFLPDFGRIVAMMQYDMYHSYTVDEHTVFAIGVLHQIETGELKDIAPVASRAVKNVQERVELYVAMLLHDIAKGRGGDHSILGAEVARQVCPRLGLDEAATETVVWLVRYHLLMSETAFRYDLNDPTTIERFAEAVQSPERLNLLLVLTVADIRAVGPNVWNGWKAALMRDLYNRTMAVLLGGDAVAVADSMAVEAGEELRLALKPIDPYWTEENIAAHLGVFYPSYWSSFDVASCVRHAEMSRKFSQSDDLVGISMTPDQARNATEIAIITADDAGLFSRIAGGVAACGASIVDARITTRKDGLTLDVLWVQNADKQAITEKAVLARMKSTLKKAMAGQLDITAAVEARWRQTPSRIRRISAPARVLINNQISSTHTVMEINGKDAPGLLYRITRTIAELGVQIQTASVSTYGDRVVDVFYVKDSFGLKIERESRIKTIRETLLKVLEDSDPANQVAA